MRITGTAIKLGALSLVLLLFTALIIVVFGQLRFDRTTGYSAIFRTPAACAPASSSVPRASRSARSPRSSSINGGNQVEVDFERRPLAAAVPGHDGLDPVPQPHRRSLHGTQAGRRQHQAPRRAAPSPDSRTEPALDLDALIGGFRPLFKALDPAKVNTIAQSIITIFQGQGGTINDILDQTASLTSALADRDQAIGEVVKNLNTVLDTTVKHQQQFDDTIKNFETLVTGLKNRADPIAAGVAQISDGAGSVADLLSENRPLLQKTVTDLEIIQQPLVDQKDQLNDTLIKIPAALKIIGRAGGIYGDFFNFYACDITLKLNGLQPGGPVRSVRVTSQPSGRCTPQ